MRAVVTSDYGVPPTVSEVQTPTAGPGEVRVRVRASSLNGFDIATVHGYFKGVFEHRFPVVLGRDFAGTVDQVGEGVAGFAVGDEVFGVALAMPLHAGGFGEYVVVPADPNLAHIPAGIDHARAGALGLAGSAAVAVVEAAGPAAGETVLVSGATGGVGAVALQLLADLGVTVIATAHGEAEVDYVRGFGATHVVDYRQDLAAQVGQLSPDGIDVVLHLAGDPTELADLLAPGGRLASLLGISPDQFAGRDITVTPAVASPVRATLQTLGERVAAGSLRIPIQRSYALADVPRAFADFAAGTLGKLAITLD